MSKQKPPKKKKKVVVTTGNKSTTSGAKKKVVSTKAAPKAKVAKVSRASAVKEQEPLPMGRDNYLLMALGVLFIVIGMFLMAGGKMPSPDVWDDSIIYSFRRTVLAPIFILAGLGIEIYAIFK
ncbi:MAG: DUF3098 domain-containing protein [Bacteroidota bacterium]